MDSNLTPFIDNNGTLEAVDTTTAGTYIITYDVKDLSGNSAEQVIRTVIVEGTSTPVGAWATEFGLADRSAAEQALDADPDADGISNLLEYALGGDPLKSDGSAFMPSMDTTSGSLVITFFKIKGDSNVTLDVQLSSKLSDPNGWDDSTVTIKGALDGVAQDDLPDGKSFAESRYERVEARPTKAMNEEDAGRQFIRIQVEHP